VTHSTLAFAIPDRDVLPEDLAYDPRTRRFFYSSVRRGRIYTGDGKEFAHAEWSIMALRADPSRRLLWATTAWLPHCEACKPEDKDKAALLAFDLDTGALKQRLASPLPGMLGAVLWLAAGSKEPVRLDSPDEFPSPQTPALSAGGKILYVSDYLRGIGAIRLADRHVEWLQPAGDIALSGIDGLYLSGDHFLAVQNGTTPARVVRFSIDLHKQEVREANSSWLGEPTHGVLVDGDFYFLANTGWGEFDQQGKKKAGAEPVESTVRRLPLK
jgi:hypothetical protein